ncbi:MAG TPA: ATP-binding protein, partial [Firmicutes bacterium]|nr:ATP-binding protein [Bacillota bacterium]
ALKYSSAGGTVRVEAARVGSSFQVVVSDTGCGISAEDLPKVKTKFYKANFTRRGSGIGLAVANEIVQQHNGSLELASQVGKGTVVTITLPIQGES